MTELTTALKAWGTPAFNEILKSELERLRSDVLPIAHVIDEGNELDESGLGAIVNEVRDDERNIYAKVGIFFNEIVACCTCSGGNGMCDEAYCELLVTIDKASGQADFKAI